MLKLTTNYGFHELFFSSRDIDDIIKENGKTKHDTGR
jgi:hypothetical protein